MTRWVFAAGWLFAALVWVGCGSPPVPTCAQGQADAGLVDFQCAGAPTISLATLQNDVLTPSCGTVGCHTATGTGINDMSSVAASKLVSGKVSAYGATSGLKVADPNNLGNSSIWLKVLGGTPTKATYAGPGCSAIGGAMPNNGQTLTATQVNEIKGWICSGAPKL